MHGAVPGGLAGFGGVLLVLPGRPGPAWPGLRIDCASIGGMPMVFAFRGMFGDLWAKADYSL
jgi:hypothetical protein